jgi:hypothetical protein
MHQNDGNHAWHQKPWQQGVVAIKSLGNRGRKNDKVMYGRTGRSKDREEHMGIVRGLFCNIFGIDQ